MIGQCAKCGCAIRSDDGCELDEGDRCWNCLDVDFKSAVDLLRKLYTRNAVALPMAQIVERWLKKNDLERGVPRSDG